MEELAAMAFTWAELVDIPGAQVPIVKIDGHWEIILGDRQPDGDIAPPGEVAPDTGKGWVHIEHPAHVRNGALTPDGAILPLMGAVKDTGALFVQR
jgi:hypothetical protein